MKVRQRWLPVLLALSLIVSLWVPVYAQETRRTVQAEDTAALLTAISDAQTGDIIQLGAGTFTITENEKMRLTVDGITLQGQGSGLTILELGDTSVSGQAGILVAADDVTIQDMTIRSTSTNGNVSTVKFSSVDNGQLLSGRIENVTLSSDRGHALNVHGVTGMEVSRVTIRNAGKCGISIANSPEVLVSETAVETAVWGSIGMMYADRAGYENPSKLILGAGNDLDTVYSERPETASQGGDQLDVSGCGESLVFTSVPGYGWQLAPVDGTPDPAYARNPRTGLYSNDLYFLTAMAQEGDTLELGQATYVLDRQLVVEKALSITGQGEGQSVLQYDGRTQPAAREYWEGRVMYPIVYASAPLVLSDLSLQSDPQDGIHIQIAGVYGTDDLTLTDVTITDIRCGEDDNNGTGICGVQTGFGVVAKGSDNVALTNVTMFGIQKQFVDVADVGTLTAEGCEITGFGPQGAIAQNGFVLRGSTNAVLSGNRIQDIQYSPAQENEWSGCSVAVYLTDRSVADLSGNEITNTDNAFTGDTESKFVFSGENFLENTNEFSEDNAAQITHPLTDLRIEGPAEMTIDASITLQVQLDPPDTDADARDTVWIAGSDLVTVTKNADGSATVTSGTQAGSVRIFAQLSGKTAIHTLQVKEIPAPEEPEDPEEPEEPAPPAGSGTQPAIEVFITIEAGPGGHVEPGPYVAANFGDDVTLTIVPDDGYVVDQVFVDGKEVVLTGLSYTFEDACDYYEFRVTFRPADPGTADPDVPDATDNPSTGDTTAAGALCAFLLAGVLLAGIRRKILLP